MTIYNVFLNDFIETLFLGAFDSEEKAQARINSHAAGTGNDVKYYYVIQSELNREVLDEI